MTNQAKQLRRIFYLLRLLSDEFEFLAMGDETSPERKKKFLRVYKEKGIDWIYRDLITSTQSANSYQVVTDALSSDHAKDMGLWLDMGIECGNLSELMEVLNQNIVKEQNNTKI